MKPGAFGYRRAQSAEHAVSLFAEIGDGAQYLAGGQSLLASLNFRLGDAGTLIDLSRLGELKGVEDRGGSILIGALTTHADVARHPLVAGRLPLVVEAYKHVAHAAIRNRGTIGGSLALGDPAAEMPACMLALDAVVHARGPRGTRAIAIDDFYLGLYETALEEGELLTHVEIPVPAARTRFGFDEIARRRGDYAMVGLAMTAGAMGARIAFFSVSDRPVRARAAEEAFARGATAQECAAAAMDGIDVSGDLNASEATKEHLARVLLRRVLQGIGAGEDA